MKAAEEPRTLGCRGYAWPGLPPPCLAFMAVKDLCSDRYTEASNSTQHIRKISQASVTLTARVSCSSMITDFQQRGADLCFLPFFYLLDTCRYSIPIYFRKFRKFLEMRLFFIQLASSNPITDLIVFIFFSVYFYVCVYSRVDLVRATP